MSLTATYPGNSCTLGDSCILVEQPDRGLRILAKVGELLAAQFGQRQMLSAVLDELERELRMTRGTIMLLSSDGSELFVEMARDIPGAERKDIRYRRGEGVIGTVTCKSTTSPQPTLRSCCEGNRVPGRNWWPRPFIMAAIDVKNRSSRSTARP